MAVGSWLSPGNRAEAHVKDRAQRLRYYFAVVGSLLLIGACWLFIRRMTLALHGVTTTGRIESFETRDMDDSESYVPVVTFRVSAHVGCSVGVGGLGHRHRGRALVLVTSFRVREEVQR